MAKKTKSELEEEGREIGEIIVAARRVSHNFALFLGKDDFIFKAHRLKKTSVMRRLAKADGAGVKGAVGELDVKGKQISLKVEDPEALPPNFSKRFRKFLNLRGHMMKVSVVSQSGELLEDATEDTPDETEDVTAHIAPEILEEVDKDLDKVRKRFTSLRSKLKKAAKSAPAKHRDKLMSAVGFYQQAVAIKSPKRALHAVKVLQKLIACTPSGENAKDSLAKAGSDPVKLSKLKGLATTLSARAKSEPAFLERNYKGMSAMRSAMRSALSQDPPPEVAAVLRDMTAGMDSALPDPGTDD